MSSLLLPTGHYILACTSRTRRARPDHSVREELLFRRFDRKGAKIHVDSHGGAEKEPASTLHPEIRPDRPDGIPAIPVFPSPLRRGGAHAAVRASAGSFARI